MTWVLHNLFNNKTKGSSEVWSDKLRLLNNKAHGVTEGRRETQCYGGAEGTKSDGGVAYRFLITFGINTLGIKLLKSVQTSSVALCTDGASVPSITMCLTILRPLRASV